MSWRLRLRLRNSRLSNGGQLSLSNNRSNILKTFKTGPFGPVFELLFSTAYLAKLSKEEQKMIDEAQKAKWDEYAINKAALDRGQNIARREIAKNMLLKNKPIEEIVEFTELPESDVLAIKAEIEKQ